MQLIPPAYEPLPHILPQSHQDPPLAFLSPLLPSCRMQGLPRSPSQPIYLHFKDISNLHGRSHSAHVHKACTYRGQKWGNVEVGGRCQEVIMMDVGRHVLAGSLPDMIYLPSRTVASWRHDVRKLGGQGGGMDLRYVSHVYRQARVCLLDLLLHQSIFTSKTLATWMCHGVHYDM